MGSLFMCGRHPRQMILTCAGCCSSSNLLGIGKMTMEGHFVVIFGPSQGIIVRRNKSPLKVACLLSSKVFIITILFVLEVLFFVAIRNHYFLLAHVLPPSSG
jgi:hypothetical protein